MNLNPEMSHIPKYPIVRDTATAGGAGTREMRDERLDGGEGESVCVENPNHREVPGLAMAGREGHDSSTPGDWRGVEIHFGAMTGVRLGDLDADSMSYWQAWMPRRANPGNLALRAALDAARVEMEAMGSAGEALAARDGGNPVVDRENEEKRAGEAPTRFFAGINQISPENPPSPAESLSSRMAVVRLESAERRCDPVPATIAAQRAAQSLHRPDCSAVRDAAPVTRLCARCGLPFHAGYSHALNIRAVFCPECRESKRRLCRGYHVSALTIRDGVSERISNSFSPVLQS